MSNPAAIGIGAPILSGRAVSHGPKRKTRRRTGGLMKVQTRSPSNDPRRMVGASTFLLPMLLRSRAAVPRTRLPKLRNSTALSSPFLTLARQKPCNKKPWRRTPTRVRMNTREAPPLDHRETLCVAAIRFICVQSVHRGGCNISGRKFQGELLGGVRHTPTHPKPHLVTPSPLARRHDVL